MSLLLLVVLVLLLVGGLPNWGHGSYGFGPSGSRHSAAGRGCYAPDRPAAKGSEANSEGKPIRAQGFIQWLLKSVRVSLSDP